MTAGGGLDPETHVLSDGTRVTIRPIKPYDRQDLLRAFERLGPRTRYQRFLTTRTKLTDEMLSYLTEVDGEDHVALIAVADSLDLKRDIGLGVARFVRLPASPDVAEAAVTVIDDMQGKGLGKVLLRELSKAACERGIRTFRGEVLASNTAMRHLLERSGARIVTDDGETLLFDVPLAAADPREDQPLQRILRAVAAWFGALRELDPG